jgi:predicted O-methyltransferase YrrM
MSGQPGKPTERLLISGLSFAKDALDIDLSDISDRVKKGVKYMDIYPGEHYKLLASIVKTLKPATVVEVGTHLGYSALCMKKFMPAGSVIHTFDVIPWYTFEDTILTESDFESGLVQCADDLTKWEEVQKHSSVLENADIIFLDALKDGKQEYLFLENFSRLTFKKKCLFIFDDIRLWNMLDIWYNLEKPKLDMTSFGHWSGTGLVEWS